MENNIKKGRKWYKKKRWWAAGFIVLMVAIWAIFFRGAKTPTYEKIVANRADLIQEVSVTGKIKPAQAVDLQFENSGRVSTINYKVGDKVSSGATIASLDNLDLQAAVTSARADLEKTKRNFESLNDTSVYSSLRVELENSQTNLEQVKVKASGDLASDYNNAVNDLHEALTQINSSSAVLEYIRKTYLEAKEPHDSTVKNYQSLVSTKLKKFYADFPEIYNSGTIGPDKYGKVDIALSDLLSAVQSLHDGFAYLQAQVQSNSYLISSSTDRASINTEATSLAADVAMLSGTIRDIADQKITNNKNIADAEAQLATAKAAFPTNDDILQKEAALLTAQASLRKTLIIAPFTGIIGKIDIERGQTVNSTIVAVALVSVANYQIEADITEVDIGKVKVGDPAVLTLDAYGAQTEFNAVVSSVDTSATIIEGVTTYKTAFDFTGPIDAGIRPNMTANIDIETGKKENVISVPQRAVVTRNGDKFVKIYLGDKIPPEERAVQLGMSGKDGYVEVVSGVNEGEQVITFIND
jgi:HlyD family secretion protein